MLITIGHYCQQVTTIKAVLNDQQKSLLVEQTILFTNTASKSIQKIVLNDWNHAYSDKYSPLGKRFSDEFVRNFHFALSSERGGTTIANMTVNGVNASWKRVNGHLDLIEIELQQPLNANNSVTIATNYVLKIPSDKFTHFGYNNNGYNLRNCFLSVSQLSNQGEFNYYSNENLEDYSSSSYKKVNIDYTLPKDYTITTDFMLLTEKETQDEKLFSFQAQDIKDISFAIEKKTSFENFKNDTLQVATNLYTSRLNNIQKAIIINKVTNFVSQTLASYRHQKIMITQADYERNPFYGLNQLPAFISPFPDDFIYEIKFLKTYLYTYLKNTLKIDQRKDAYIFDAIQMYVMMNYIEQNYPDSKLLGSISSFKIFKGYHITNVGFNDQYDYFYLLMARENLDQTIGNPKNTFIKFNEQIAGKYKAGLSFKYLNAYLQDNTVQNSFKEFVNLNANQQTNATHFESILKKNAIKNIDWFFPSLIYSRSLIDYKLNAIKKDNNEVQVTIQNKGNAIVPITFYGLNKKDVITKQWFNNIKTDTTFTINKSNINRLGLNYENEIPEFNARNNWKSLRSIFSMNRPLKFNFYKDLENPKYAQIFYFPEISFNLYDGILSSIDFNNKSFLDKPFVASITPSYSFKTGNIYGSGGFSLNKYYRDSKLYSVRYGFSGSYFQYAQNSSYFKVNPSIQVRFRENDFRNNTRKVIFLRHVFVNKDPSPVNNSDNTAIASAPLSYSVFNARYIYTNNEMVKGFSTATDVQFAGNFGKISADVNYRKLFENNFELGLRLYAGAFLYKNTTSDFFNFGLDRPKDYLFDYNFYGRSESKGFFSQQIIIAEGGFKSKFKNPYANQWITACNANASIWQWIQMYGDVGLYKNKDENTQFVYDSGIHFNFVPNYFEVYCPVYSTNGFELGQKNYQEKIRFVVTFNPKILIGLFTRKWF